MVIHSPHQESKLSLLVQVIKIPLKPIIVIIVILWALSCKAKTQARRKAFHNLDTTGDKIKNYVQVKSRILQILE